MLRISYGSRFNIGSVLPISLSAIVIVTTILQHRPTVVIAIRLFGGMWPLGELTDI